MHLGRLLHLTERLEGLRSSLHASGQVAPSHWVPESASVKWEGLILSTLLPWLCAHMGGCCLGSEGQEAAARNSQVGLSVLASPLLEACSKGKAKIMAWTEVFFASRDFLHLSYKPWRWERAYVERRSSGSRRGALKGPPLPFSFSITVFSQ